MDSAESNRASSPPAEAAPPHATPAEHRRNRKLWTAEEQRAFWRVKKSEKKLRKKASAADRQAALRAEWETLTEVERQQRKEEAMAAHEQRRLHEEAFLAETRAHLDDPRLPVLVFDLSFAWCMTVADTKSTVSQIKFSYSTLRSAAFPLRPAITSLMGREAGDTAHDATEQARVLSTLQSFEGFAKFPPRVTEEHWSSVYPPDKVVFLTADAEETLDDVKEDLVYIVGAFVDHNQHKGLSRAAAERHGVRMARLPLKESIDMGNRCMVLTVNHVVNVLTAYAKSKARNTLGTGKGDWRMVLEQTLPQRRVQQEVCGSRKRRRQAGNEVASRGTTDTEDAAED